MLPKKISEVLNEQQTGFLEKFFQKCNEPFLQYLMLITCPKNHVLINTDDQCSFVYILLKGRLQAVEEYATDQPYHFTELGAVDIVGDYELFTKTSSRMITLTTLEESLFLVIPGTDYITWIQADANALYMRIRMLIQQIVDQTRFERHNFFLDNRARMLYFLRGECISAVFPRKIAYTHEEISNKLGCSLRTVNRTISALQAEHLISIRHGKIWIFAEQYEKIQNVLHRYSVS